jgi:hypothetical protein
MLGTRMTDDDDGDDKPNCACSVDEKSDFGEFGARRESVETAG